MRLTPFQNAANTARSLMVLSFIIFSAGAAFGIDGSATVTGSEVKFFGATETNWVNGSELVITFAADGSFILPGQTKARILAVGGGGGGGGAYTGSGSFAGNYGGGGGGGAGGFVEVTNVFAAATYSISIGGGGAGGAYNNRHGTAYTYGGSSGGNTIVSTNEVAMITAYGGGGGGGESVGLDGGSGGGGSMYRTTAGSTRAGGSALAGQGHAGGSGDKGTYGGGGGGAGGAGAPASILNPVGGDGRPSNITGSDVWYAGGGGGAHSDKTITTATEGIAGGLGGGGIGGVGTTVAAGDGTFYGGGGGGANASTSSGGGGKGHAGVVIVRIIVATESEIVKPVSQTVDFDGTEHVLVSANPAYTIVDKTDGSPTYDQVVDKVSGTASGTYKAEVTLVEGFKWPDGTDAPVTATLTISKATPTISNLAIRNWIFGTPVEATPKPYCEPSIAGAPVIYEYGDSATGPWAAAKPTAVGTHWVRARIEETPSYNAAVSDPVSFEILNGPGDVFRDYVEIMIDGAVSAVANFIYTLQLSESSPVGFLYSRAGATGEALALTDADGIGLAYKVDEWNTNGTSRIFVKLPTLSTSPQTIRLFWCVRDGKTAPGPTPAIDDPSGAAQPGYTFDLVVRDGRRVNYWLTYPELTKTSWDSADDPGTVASYGTLAEGAASLLYVTNLNTGAVSPGITTAGGYFSAVFGPYDPVGVYEPLEYGVDFFVIGHVTYDDLSGGVGLTQNGRVLLANDVANTGSDAGYAVTDQSYWQTDPSAYSTYWVHSGEPGDKTTYPCPYLMPLSGSPYPNHVLCMTTDGGATSNELWTLTDVYIGNQYSTGPSLLSTRCALPYSTSSKAISSASAAAGLAESGNMLLRNKVGANILSPVYTNGIGTIYFDVVNGDTYDVISAGHSKIAVRISTDGGETWTYCKMKPFKTVGGSAFTADQTDTTELTLAITSGGGADSFYRVCVPVDVSGNVRFSIERTAVNPGKIEDYSYILVDNIVVSYPKSTASLVPYGKFDSSLKGRQVLGWAGSMSEPFPSVGSGEIYARAVPVVVTNAVVQEGFEMPISWAQMHYRWRYLDQKTNDWDTVLLRPMDDFISALPLKLPSAEGDVEFWFDYIVQVPAYKYHDYSGLGLGLSGADGKAVYTEDVTKGTNTQVKTTGYARLPSGGNDWFFRIRRGESEWESFTLYAKEGEAGAVKAYDMILYGKHMWRGFCPTYKELEDGLYIRIAANNAQTAGSAEYDINKTRYALASDAGALPATGEMATCADEESWAWRKVPCDGKSGQVMVQLQDDTLAYSVVHSDYQDFNHWTDANKKDGKGLFVGTSTDTNDTHMAGTTAKAVTYTTHFGNWNETIATNQYWSESFYVKASEIDKGRWKLYTPFEVTPVDSPNGLSVGPGQWVNGFYRANNTGMALQMEGRGKGYIQLVDFMNSPRGIESLSFRARVSQAIEFKDFCYYMTDPTSLANYTFMTAASFDVNQRKDFAGKASLSLVALYTPNVGCYEMRVEQETASVSATGVVSPGARLRYSLYRWAYDEEYDDVTETLLGTECDGNTDSGAVFNTNGENGNYARIFISVDTSVAGETRVVGGVSRTTAARANFFASASYREVMFRDKTASRLTTGTYGLLSANCPAHFMQPSYGPASVTYQAPTKEGFQYGTWTITPIASSSRKACKSDLASGKWAISKSRMVAVNTTDEARYGINAKTDVKTTVSVYTAPAGSDKWKPFMTQTVTGFGSSASAGTITTVPIYSREECSVKLAAGGTERGARVDVTIDDIEFRQWRGENYDSKGQAGVVETTFGAYSNIVFTQGWMSTNIVVSADVTNRTCLLSAKRTKLERSSDDDNDYGPASIRSPRMVDEYDKGLGLGQLTFTYENAQSNAVVLVQIATNSVAMSTFGALTKSTDETLWTTVTNFDFSTGELATKRASGQLSVFFGLHGVRGAMRIALDPKTVDAVKDVMDPTAFGEITITGIAFRDEPMLDKYSWWGWNLRTTDELDKRNIADNQGDALYDGLSFGLNNSVTEDIRTDEPAARYKQRYPLLQTPTFATNLVNEISFLARLYDPSAGKARVTLYGAKSGDLSEEALWSKLEAWDVTNTTFEAYTRKFGAGNSYQAFRLAVTGVDGVEERMPDDDPFVPAQRVLLDEVLVMEGVVASVGFRNVGAFRTGLDETTAVTNLLSKEQQPLCKEEWGVQCEVYASQLADEVDLSNARVRLWWYEAPSPWGFDRWKGLPGAKKAWLAPASDSNLVFRSGYYGASGAVMPAQPTVNTVQWTLEVIYSANGAPQTNWLSSAEWSTPPWYAPIDYNEEYGRGAFSAYTILDTVAPGWAWINEVNLFGEYDDNYANSDKPLQFVEVAAPSDADLTGWTVRFLDAKISGESPARLLSVVTNDVAVFGESGLPGLKRGLKGMDEDTKTVFHVIGSPYTKGVLSEEDGRLDGLWSIRVATDSAMSGEIMAYYPIGIQLVRPSGIVEHELVAIGTNEWASLTSIYDPEKAAELLKAAERGGRFFSAGMDSGGVPAGSPDGWSRSLGVFAGNGSTFMQWGCTNLMSPGRLNAGQVAPKGAPTPRGSALVIYSIISGGDIWQTFGPYEDTADTVTLVYRKGSPQGTNITWRTSKWHEIGTVTVNGLVASPAATGNPREWALSVGKATSNDITVVASAQVDASLAEKYGVPSTSRYRDAIVKWLMRGMNAYGDPWHDPDATDLGLADFADRTGNVQTNLTLTEMYWLDIDPTWSDHDIVFKAGWAGNSDIPMPKPSGHGELACRVYMQITNTVVNSAWAPYILQGCDFENNSWVYADPLADWQWTNATFKIAGRLLNTLTSEDNERNWIPLRWFVFAPDSFDADYTSYIELADPTSTESPGYSAGWYDWVQEHGSPGFGFQLRITERGMPQEAEVLRKENPLQ